MEKYPLVSFLIAAYNEEKYVEECVLSCLDQTYPNIEVCVTDDGSTDSTWNILEEKYKNNPKVKLSKFDKNKGKVAAFNKSYEMAEGEYFALIGADDVNMKSRITKSYDFISANEYDFIFASFEVCDEKLNDSCFDISKPSKKFSVENILMDNFIPGGTMFFSKKIAACIFPIPEILKFEDWWISFIAAFYGEIGFFDKKVIKYRYTGKNNQIFADETISKKYNTIAKNYKRHFDYYKVLKEYIQNQDVYKNKNKKKILKIIELGIIHKTIVVEDKLLARIKSVPRFLKNVVFDVYTLKLFVLFILGIKPLLGIHRYFYKIKN